MAQVCEVLELGEVQEPYWVLGVAPRMCRVALRDPLYLGQQEQV
jgi:hypothetical protein